MLLLDTSHSMILYGEDRFTPAKKVALALTHLIRTQFPGDTLRVVLFGDRAEEIPLSHLAHAQVGPFHTNTAEGLKLARRLLLAQNKEMRQIVMITDGKPCADHPPRRARLQEPHGPGPARAARDLPRGRRLPQGRHPHQHLHAGARPRPGRPSSTASAQIARGKAYFTTTMTLGQYIMRDFLRRRTRRAG